MRACLAALLLAACVTPTGSPLREAAALAPAVTTSTAEPDGPIAVIPDDVQTGLLANGVRFYLVPTEPASGEVELLVRAGTLDEGGRIGVAHLLAHQFADVDLEESSMPIEGAVTERTTTYTLGLDSVTPEDLLLGHAATDDLTAKLRVLRAIVDGPMSALRLAQVKARMHEVLHPYADLGLDYERRHSNVDNHPRWMPAPAYQQLGLADLDAFRAAWYRADRITLLIGSPLPPQIVRATLERTFGTLPSLPPLPERPFVAPPHPRLVVEETTHVYDRSVSLVQRLPHERRDTLRSARATMLDDIVMYTVAKRASIANGHPGDFTYERERFTDDVDLGVIHYTAQLGWLEDGVALLTTEMERVRRFGVTRGELDEAVAVLTTDADHDLHDMNGEHYDVERWLVDGEPAPSELYASRARLAPGLTAEDVRVAALTRFDLVGRTMEFSPRAYMRSKNPTDLARDIEAIANGPLERWDRRLAVQPILPQGPSPGTIIERRRVGSWTIFDLGNGARVFVRAPEDQDSAESVAAFAPGGWDAQPAPGEAVAGTSLLPVALGQLAVAHVREHAGNVWVGLARREHEVHVSMHDDSLESAMQLVYLAYMTPHPDRAARFPAPTTSTVHRPTLLDEFYNPGRHVPPPVDTSLLDPDRAWAAMQHDLHDLRHTTFLVTTTAGPDVVAPLVATYLASIPDDGERARPSLPTGAPPSELTTRSSKRGEAFDVVVLGETTPSRDPLVALFEARALLTALDDSTFAALADDGRVELTRHVTLAGRYAQPRATRTLLTHLAALGASPTDDQLAAARTTTRYWFDLEEWFRDAIRFDRDPLEAATIVDRFAADMAAMTRERLAATARRFTRVRVLHAIDPASAK